jgi:hypothetical protein
MKAMDAYPPNNKGTFAQELIKEMNFELEQSARTGKYSVTKSALMRLPECSAKHFLLHGDAAVLDRDVSMKISMKLWREDNDGAYFNIQSKDQLGEIAFGVLGIKPLSTTKTGKPQFDDDTNDVPAKPPIIAIAILLNNSGFIKQPQRIKKN